MRRAASIRHSSPSRSRSGIRRRARSDAREPRDVGGIDEAPLPVAPLRPGIGIEQIDAGERRRRQPVEQVDRVAVVQADIRELAPSIAASALAMPLTNGSPPMKPTRGCACACAIRCSAPPKPISSRTSSTGSETARARFRRGRAADRAQGAAAACRTAPPGARARDVPCGGRRMRRCVGSVVAHAVIS